MNFAIVRNNQNGSAIIGFLLAVLVMAVIIGGFYFSRSGNPNDPNYNPNDPNTLVDTLNKAKSDIADINKQTEQRNVETSDPYVSEEQVNPVTSPEAGEGQGEVLGNDSIQVFNIKENQTVSSPLRIEGQGRAFENTLIVELRDENHNVKVQEFVTTKSADAGEIGPFAITLYFEFSNTKSGYVAVYEQSAKDGTEQNFVEIPVNFTTKE